MKSVVGQARTQRVMAIGKKMEDALIFERLTLIYGNSVYSEFLRHTDVPPFSMMANH